jgi:hypothetical protein
LLSQVDSDVTPALIAGNSSKYVGTYVLVDCVISNVIGDGDDKEANASCSQQSSASGDGQLVLTGDVGNFDVGQSVTILGQVAHPVEGTNGFGASTTFPTIHVLFLNPTTNQPSSAQRSDDVPSNGENTAQNSGTPEGSESVTVESFYRYITSKNYSAAYALLSPSYKQGTTFPEFVKGYATTLSVDADAKDSASGNDVVDVTLHAEDLKNGSEVDTTYVGTWKLVPDGHGRWLLDTGSFTH